MSENIEDGGRLTIVITYGLWSVVLCVSPHSAHSTDKCCPVTWPPVQSTQWPAQCSVGAWSRRRTDVAVMTARWSALGVLYLAFTFGRQTLALKLQCLGLGNHAKIPQINSYIERNPYIIVISALFLQCKFGAMDCKS